MKRPDIKDFVYDDVVDYKMYASALDQFINESQKPISNEKAREKIIGLLLWYENDKKEFAKTTEERIKMTSKFTDKILSILPKDRDIVFPSDEEIEKYVLSHWTEDKKDYDDGFDDALTWILELNKPK